MGERTPLALLDAPASARMAVGRGAHQPRRGAASRSCRDVKLSANWMAACRRTRRGRRAVRHGARGRRWSCARRSASRSRSARTRCRCARRGASGERRKAVTAPVSLIVTAFAPVADVRGTLTPQLRTRRGDTALLLVDLGARQATGWAARRWRRCYGAARRRRARPRRPGAAARASSRRVQRAARATACCSRTTTARDGGLFATLCEMAFAGRAAGLEIDARRLRRRSARARCSPRSWARCCRCARADVARVRDVLARARPGRLRARDRARRAPAIA